METKARAAEAEANIKDTALIFEGGGMRASYTAGVVVTLLEAGLRFKDVYGISAGSSHTVNYVSRDVWRARASFTDFMDTPGTSGWALFLQGKGYFNAEYIYQKACLPGERLPFDFDAFMSSASSPHIASFDADAGRMAVWTKSDMPTLHDLMTRVRASSTIPRFMPPVMIDGHAYVDGGIGDDWGLPLGLARKDGYQKFLVVRTQERSYRKGPPKHPLLTRAMFPRRKAVAERLIDRWRHYNGILDELGRLEEAGQACVFCPDRMDVTSMTTDHGALSASYAAGYAQAQRELPRWEMFLA